MSFLKNLLFLLFVILLSVCMWYLNKLINVMASWLLKSFSYKTHQIILNTQQVFLCVTGILVAWYSSLDYFFRKIYNIELYELYPFVSVIIGGSFLVASFMYVTIIRIYVGEWPLQSARRYNAYKAKFILKKYDYILEDYNCITPKQYRAILWCCFLGAFCLFIATYVLTMPFKDIVQRFCLVGTF